MHIEAKLRKLGLELPEVKKPAGLYVFTKRVGNLVYVSGQTPDIGSILQYKGVVGEDMSIETAQQAAQLAALNILAVLKSWGFRPHPPDRSSGRLCPLR